MKSLSSFISKDHIIWLNLALGTEKSKKNGLNILKVEVLATYQVYKVIINSINTPLPDSIFDNEKISLLKELFMNLYSYPTAKLKDLLVKKRRLHELEECPYCGNPTIPDTLDHFVPKNILAEYSIYPNNLVPQCKSCAPIKGARFYENGKTLFIHPFYSNLLDTISIEIKSSFKNGNYDFKIMFMSDVQKIQDRELIENHINSLRIKKRIKQYCFSEVKRWERKLSESKFDIEEVLKARINEYNGVENINNWGFVLYNSLLKEDVIINHLKSIIPRKVKTNTIPKKIPSYLNV